METYRVRRVEITSDREQPRELDGDVIEPSRSLAVTVRPGALCLCVPEDRPRAGSADAPALALTGPLTDLGAMHVI
jgi:hypothetical protein